MKRTTRRTKRIEERMVSLFMKMKQLYMLATTMP